MAQPITLHAVAHLVVVLRKDDEPVCRNIARHTAVTPAAKARILAGVSKTFAIGFNELREFAVVLIVTIAFTGEQCAQTMVKIVIPDRIQTVAAELSRPNQAAIVIGAFGDQIRLAFETRKGLMHFAAQLVDESNRRMIENRMHGIEAQRIDVKFRDPIQSILNKEFSYLIAEGSVEVERRSPRRLVAIGEVRSEVGEIISFRTEMIVDHVENHREAAPVTGIDEPLHRLRSTVGVLHRERQHTVVAPIAAAGKLRYRHQLDRRDTQLKEIFEIGNQRIKGARRRESADVQLVNNIIFERYASPAFFIPAKIAVDHL